MTADGWLLSDDELATLDTGELAEYHRLLSEVTSHSWALDGNPKAHLLHLIANKVDWTLGGGAAGGGKSEALAFHAREQARLVPGSHSLVLRSKKPELRRSFILRTIVRFAQTGDDKRAKRAERNNVIAWWWNNGSIIEFGFAARAEDAAQYLSAEYDLVIVDESTQLTPETLTLIFGRLRTTKAKALLGARPHALLASNPGDVGHAWHKELFVDLTDYGKFVVVLDISDGFTTDDGQIDWERCKVVQRVPAPTTVEEAEAFDLTIDPASHLSIAFVPFRATDNPYLDPSVMKNLNALPEMRRRQLRDGDWDAFAGRFFTEFGDAHLVPAFEPPESWEFGIGIDHGWTAPFAAVFGAWDGDGNCWIFDEVYEKELTPQQQAALVQGKMRRHDPETGKNFTIRPRRIVADPAVFSTKGEGRSIADQWRDAGLHTVAANNQRIDGWMNMREYLRIPFDNENQPLKPKLFVMPDRCPNFVREMRNAAQDTKRLDDVDTTGSDHALDACRYLLAMRPRRARSRIDPYRDLPELQRREAVRLDKYRKAGRAAARRLGLT